MITLSDLGELILTGMLNYGAWALGLVMLITAIGVPLPATMLLIASGAFANQGALDPISTIFYAFIGATAGDNISYLLGRFGSTLLPDTERMTAAKANAEHLFSRWGAAAIFLSRFLLTPLALPINLIAGSTGYPFWRYFTLVVCGEIVWVFLYAGIGFWFADRWEKLSALASDVAGILAGVVLLLGSGFYLLRRITRPQRRSVG